MGEVPAVIASLEEKVAVDPALINGVAPAPLRGDGTTPFTVTFVSEFGVQDNALGYYVVGENGVIGETGILFRSTEDAVPGATIETPVLAEDETLGLFLVADGGGLDADTFAFVNTNGKAADVDFVYRPTLLADGVAVDEEVLHASDYVESDVGNRLNPKAAVRTLSAQDEAGVLYVAFEDLPSNPDNDVNDVVLKIQGPGLGLADGFA